VVDKCCCTKGILCDWDGHLQRLQMSAYNEGLMGDMCADGRIRMWYFLQKIAIAAARE
jgi:DNA-binding transcriptional regulator of glucitol operon